MAPSRGLITVRPGQFICGRCFRRAFTASSTQQSGHNRWSKIRHDKGKNDAQKNRQRSAFAQEIATVSKLFGPEPSLNTRLADLFVKAKREGLPKATLEAAIARGQGRSATGANLESLTVEGILPNNVAVIVDCETDSRLRTLSDVRLAMKSAGGSATSCAHLFEKRGRVVFESKRGVGLEEALEAALESGATDVEQDDDGNIVVFCEPGVTKAVGEAVSDTLGVDVKSSEIIWWPNEVTKIPISTDEALSELNGFVDELLDKSSSITAISMNVAEGENVRQELWKEFESRICL